MFIRLAAVFFSTGLAFAFPVLTYSTYLRDSFAPTAIATDSSGNIYLAGNATVDPALFQTTVLVVKLNPQANRYLYVRYLGGSANDSASAIQVDRAGNAYVTGTTTSPDFPVTSGSGNLATAPSSGTERSFVAKLDPNGQLVFSALLGGLVNSIAQAVAVNAAGQVLVSGFSIDKGFPSNGGVYSVADTSFRPYLLELDATGTKVIFSATGIGGTALAFDGAGNIYMAGTTNYLDYPTTPGSYQPAFPGFETCVAPCGGMFQGANQYVTKLDPTGAKMIFSTAVSGNGNTANHGLAVDSAGNVYLTGLAGAGYPYTVTPPAAPLGPALAALSTPAVPFLTKLDAAGQKLLYSVPVGGVGVQVDAGGNAYVGGVLGQMGLYQVAANLPALANLPATCQLTDLTNGKSAYVAQVDASGNVLGSQFLGGSKLTLAGAALAGSTLWVAGATYAVDFPTTPNSPLSPGAGTSSAAGAYLGAVDFSRPQPAASAPQIACVVDAANLEPAGPVAPSQVLTILGSGLGPATPVSASDNTSTSLGGVSVTYGGQPAPLLYVSANQINVALPGVNFGPAGATLQVTVNGVQAAGLRFPMVLENPGLFSVPDSYSSQYQAFAAVAANADGSLNSAANPARAGSVISVFVNGISFVPGVTFNPQFLNAGGGFAVVKSTQITPFVREVDLQTPASLANFGCQTNVCTVSFKVTDLNATGVAFSGFVYLSAAGLQAGGF